MKKRVNISLDEETVKRLKELAKEEHKSVSQWITDKIWETKTEVKTAFPEKM